MVYKIIIGFLFITTTSCSSISSVASLSSNGATFFTTGKTTGDLVVSYLLEKDCKLFRVVARPKRKVCQ